MDNYGFPPGAAPVPDPRVPLSQQAAILQNEYAKVLAQPDSPYRTQNLSALTAEMGRYKIAAPMNLDTFTAGLPTQAPQSAQQPGTYNLNAFTSALPVQAPQVTDASGAPSMPFSATQGGAQGSPAQAFASGVNEGALTYLPGLPVKLALDATDLARAGYGYLGSKLGLLAPSQLPLPLDRAQYVASPQWFQKVIRDAGASKMIDATGDTEADRVLHAAGTGVGSSLAPGSSSQAVKNAISNAFAGGAGQAAYDDGLPPGAATAVSLAPWAARAGVGYAGPAALRGAVRGGATGAARMQNNIDTLKAAGVQAPPAGLAAGNSFGSAMDTFLSMVPGSSGVMAKAGENLANDLSNSASAAASRMSPVQTPMGAGSVLQAGIDAYKARLGATTGHLYDRVGRLIPDDFLFPATQALATGGRLSADIPNMPNVSKILKPDIVPKVNAAMTADVAPRAPVTTTVNSPVLNSSGDPFTSQVTTPGSPGGITFPAMQDVRTLIGQNLNDALLTSNANRAALKQYYGALTGDMKTAAAMTDLSRMAASGSTQVPSAVNALDRANRIYGMGQDRLELLQPFADKTAPEAAFHSLEGSLAGGKQPTIGSQVMASLTPEERAAQAATIASRLGTATPGQQNSTGTAFSPQTFLTNWNRMTPEGKDAAFGPASPFNVTRTRLQAIADAAGLVRQQSRAWANPSGTAAKNALWEVLGGAGASAGGLLFTGHPVLAAGTLGATTAGLLGLRSAARALTAPGDGFGSAQWFANPTQLPIGVLPSQLQRLATLPQYQTQ